jgi:hypothetical protein
MYDASPHGQRTAAEPGAGSHRKQYSSDSDRRRKFAAFYFSTTAEILMHNA